MFASCIADWSLDVFATGVCQSSIDVVLLASRARAVANRTRALMPPVWTRRLPLLQHEHARMRRCEALSWALVPFVRPRALQTEFARSLLLSAWLVSPELRSGNVRARRCRAGLDLLTDPSLAC